MSKGRALLSILLATVMASGCVNGLVLRAVTWPWDPGRFWVVIRDSGVPARSYDDFANDVEGKCAIVWNDTLMEGLRTRVADDPRGLGETESGGQALWCEWDILSTPSARAAWLNDGEGYFDLSLPKSGRIGPRVFDNEPFGIILGLHGPRFGNSFFCVVRVKTESVTAILNAGVNKDVHVYVGTGSRYCTI